MSLDLIFTAFLVMLGPLKMVFPFFMLTSGDPAMDEKEARRVSLKAIGIACGVGILAAVVGQSLLNRWGISLPALHLAAGIVLVMIALQNLLSTYSPAQSAPPPAESRRSFILSPLVYPIILSPYGIGVFILILASTQDLYRQFVIFGLFLLVMAINLLFMWFTRAIIRYVGGFLLILGAVVGVLQVALAIQMMLDVLRTLQVLPF